MGPPTCHESLDEAYELIGGFKWLRIYEVCNGEILQNIYPEDIGG
jgi:hypothetical protein